jgi:glycosyltransferase involved in cell wall biosynthesis
LTPYPASLVILTLNERAGSEALLDLIPFDRVAETIVVDGGSTDGTRELWAAHGFRVVDQTRPGRGEAFRVGAAATSEPMICFFSPDGNEDPADIPRLLARLDEGFDLAIASRFALGAVNEEDVHWFRPRAWVNRLLTWIANRLFNRGPFVTDTINGYRAISRVAFERLQLTECGFPIEYQMSIRAMRAGLRIAELPTQEGQRIGGESKAHSIPVGVGHLKVLFSELSRTR